MTDSIRRMSHATLVAASIASPAFAAGDPAAIEQQLNALQQALARQQEQLAQQQQEIAQLREQLQQAKLADQNAAQVTMNGARPAIKSADGQSSVALRSVVQLDAANYSADADRGAADFRRGSVGAGANREAAAARDFSDGAYFRRARFGFEGAVARDFTYRVIAELGGSGTEGPARINDFWIGYTGLAPFTIQVGAFSPPANMDDSINVESSLFIERSTPAEVSRTLGGADGRIGLGVRGSGARWMSALTLTTRTVNDPEVLDSQLAAVGRFGTLLATSSDYNVHVGLSGTWVFQPPDQGSNVIRFRDRPEIRVDSTRLVDTGLIDADSAYVFGLESAANWKNWYLQAESFRFGVERTASTSALPDPTFDGFYVQGSWILTGETRRYDVATGAFQAPRPFASFSAAGGLGAWELALRFSRLDLDFHAGAAGTGASADAIRGGVQDIWTFGVNWYINSNVKLMLNWLRVDVDRLNPAGVGNLLPFGPTPATPPLGVQIGQDLDIVGLRTQYSF